MSTLGKPELIIILLIALAVFGGDKIPELGRGLGHAIRDFRDGLQDPLQADDNDGNLSDGKSESEPAA